VDGHGRLLGGDNRYIAHFDKGLTPPVNAFWSVTMYDPQSFFVDNPINRYAISSDAPYPQQRRLLGYLHPARLAWTR
jgi:DNA sulfur modification protein DndE